MNAATLKFSLVLVVSSLAARSGLAATPTASFGVTVTVQAACQVSPDAKAFEAFHAVKTNAKSMVSVTCTNPTPYVVEIVVRSTEPGNGATRGSSGPNSTLPGNAITPKSHGSIGLGRTAGANNVAVNGNQIPQSLLVQGQMVAEREVVSGTNAEMLAVTF